MDAKSAEEAGVHKHCYLWGDRISCKIWVGQAPHPTRELVPALPELASTLGEESLGLPKQAGFPWGFGYCALLSSGTERI